jgi:hypothetical protein
MQIMKSELSMSDKVFIEDNKDSLSIAEMSKTLNVTQKCIKTYLNDVLREPQNPEEETATLPAPSDNILHSNPKWQLLKQEFTPDELTLFEYSYKELFNQFQGDVLPTEDRQIFQAIELEIFMHRNKKNRKRSADEIKRLEIEIEEERQKFQDSITGTADPEDVGSKDKIDFLRAQLGSYLAASTSSSKEYTELLTKHKDIIDKLKGTRDQRIKQFNDKNLNIMEKLKSLEDEETRFNERIEMEIMRKASQQFVKTYSQLHTYSDGNIDIPILTKESYESIQIEEPDGLLSEDNEE